MRRSFGRRDFLSSVAVTTISATAFSGSILGAVAASVADENKSVAAWKVGVSRTVITPETSVWLAGYGTKRAPDGKLHDLWMKALALEDSNGIRAVLITSDFQGVPKMMSDRVFQQLKDKFQFERSQIMFTFSHNHCGPRLGDDLIDYYPVEAEQEQLVKELCRDSPQPACRLAMGKRRSP
jgi:neutral ceramidase